MHFLIILWWKSDNFFSLSIKVRAGLRSHTFPQLKLIGFVSSASTESGKAQMWPASECLCGIIQIPVDIKCCARNKKAPSGGWNWRTFLRLQCRGAHSQKVGFLWRNTASRGVYIKTKSIDLEISHEIFSNSKENTWVYAILSFTPLRCKQGPETSHIVKVLACRSRVDLAALV